MSLKTALDSLEPASAWFPDPLPRARRRNYAVYPPAILFKVPRQPVQPVLRFRVHPRARVLAPCETPQWISEVHRSFFPLTVGQHTLIVNPDDSIVAAGIAVRPRALEKRWVEWEIAVYNGKTHILCVPIYSCRLPNQKRLEYIADYHNLPCIIDRIYPALNIPGEMLVDERINSRAAPERNMLISWFLHALCWLKSAIMG